MSTVEPENIFNETNRATINIPQEVYKKKKEHKPYSYQTLLDKLGIENNITLFTITVLIGKYVVKKREKFGNSIGFFRFSDNEHKDEMNILKALAVHEVNNIYVLKDQEEMCNIWEEYSYAGFKELYSWYEDNNTNFETKLVECILNSFDELNQN